MARVELSQDREVAWIRLIPHAGRLMPEHITDVANHLGKLEQAGGTRAVIVTGARDAFGGDWVLPPLAGRGEAEPVVRTIAAALVQVAECRLPVIAAISGCCLSAGLDLALACDIRVASAGAEFGFPEVAAGRLPLGGGVARLARLVGRAAATRMLLMGDVVDAEEALRLGLVSSVTPETELAEEAARLARVIAGRGPIAVAYGKEALRQGMEMPLEPALRYETDLTVLLQATADRAEGIAAFAEKRTPVFRGE